MAYQDVDKQLRECKKCGEIKVFDNFPRCKNSNNGHTWICKSCTKKRQDQWKLDNHDHVVEQRYIYKQKNKSIIAMKNREYDLKNKERRAETKKKWQEDNKEYCRAESKKYRAKTRAKRYEYELAYKESNREKINERRRKNRNHHNAYIKNKKETDENFKMACILRGRFKIALKQQGAIARSRTLDIIGCSLDFFVEHIKEQFTEGMSWDKLGLHGIHLDHIRPCSSFDLTDLGQQKQCFHYSNMQPLWAKDNLQKSNKLDWKANE